jgi:hypothetical protein
VAPAARRQRAETSLGKKPRSGPRDATVSLMQEVIVADVTDGMEVKTRAMGVSGVAAC